jgi:hypothetical protein
MAVFDKTKWALQFDLLYIYRYQCLIHNYASKHKYQ